jgi:hypothetical protein
VQDIEDRLRILNNLSASAQKQADEMEAKMIEWQTKLVELSAAKDKASRRPYHFHTISLLFRHSTTLSLNLLLFMRFFPSILTAHFSRKMLIRLSPVPLPPLPLLHPVFLPAGQDSSREAPLLPFAAPPLRRNPLASCSPPLPPADTTISTPSSSPLCRPRRRPRRSSCSARSSRA